MVLLVCLPCFHRLQVLNNLDCLDETEILKLVNFKNVLMNFAPVLAKRALEEELSRVNIKDNFGNSLNDGDDENSVGSTSSAHSTGSMNAAATGSSSSVNGSHKKETALGETMKGQKLKVTAKSKATSNIESMGVVLSDIDLLNLDANGSYDIPSGPLQYKTAVEILEVYKHGGRLSEHTAHRVLRAAYRSLSTLPNVSRMCLAREEEKLTVVGDLHGQLSDLIYIFQESGLPTTNSKYIFNGDFVDRGLEGVEITLILLAFHVSLPGSVYLNRGNHEDYMIMCNYGFQEECSTKYNLATFGMVSEVFQHLPLMTVINDAVLVVHGGLFHDVDVKVSDMDSFVRCEFSLLDIPEAGETLMGIDPKTNPVEYHKQLQRDALWSDPCSAEGKNESSRGAGISFGPDVTATFLTNNGLSLVVRSHECVQHGFDYPYRNATGHENILCTLFSASNYGGTAKNRGAFMEFRMTPDGKCNRPTPTSYTTQEVLKKDLDVPVAGANLIYAVHEYHITAEMDRMMKRAFTAHSMSIHEIILRKQENLRKAFRKREVVNGTGCKETDEFSNFVSTEDWLAVMAEVTGAEVHWGSMLAVLVPPSSRDTENNTIHYADFLNQYTLDQQKHLDCRRLSRRKSSNKTVGGGGGNAPGSPCSSSPDPSQQQTDPVIGFEATEERYNAIEGLYSQYKELKLIFEFFDARNTGELTKEDFTVGCRAINETLPPDQQLEDTDELFRIADLDGSGILIANEFFEVFRIVNMRPGQRGASPSPDKQKAALAREQSLSELEALPDVDFESVEGSENGGAADDVDDSDDSDDETVVPEISSGSSSSSGNRLLTRKDTMEVKGHLINAL